MNEKDILISQFIDDELNIDEKIEFIKELHSDTEYFNDAVGLLEMEKALATPEPPKIAEIYVKKPLNFSMYASFAALAASLIVAVKIFLFAPHVENTAPVHRFVVYLPDAGNVEVTGSFSEWQPVRMQKVSGGYWQVSLPLTEGEHSYSYIIDGSEQLPDPTVPAKQDDGFGGENSIITIGENI